MEETVLCNVLKINLSKLSGLRIHVGTVSLQSLFTNVIAVPISKFGPLWEPIGIPLVVVSK